MIKKTSTRQMLHFNKDACKLGLFVSCTGAIGYGCGEGMEAATNRISPDKVWIDADGFIHVKVERRNPEPQTKSVEQ